MPRGGTLTLRTRFVREAEGPGRVRIDVEDNGVGMDEQTKSQALAPFFTTKAVGLGTGLGLSIVRDTIAACGGEVTITSAPTQGTIVSIVLPVATAEVPTVAALAPGTVADQPPAALANAAKILLLEDDPAVQRAFMLTLRKQGYDVVVTSCVAEAEAAVASGAAFDLFLSDAVLPDGNPGALIRRFRTLHPNRPILVCSGHLLDDAMIQGVAHDEFHFLQKPVLPSALRKVVGELLGTSGQQKALGPAD